MRVICYCTDVRELLPDVLDPVGCHRESNTVTVYTTFSHRRRLIAARWNFTTMFLPGVTRFHFPTITIRVITDTNVVSVYSSPKPKPQLRMNLIFVPHDSRSFGHHASFWCIQSPREKRKVDCFPACKSMIVKYQCIFFFRDSYISHVRAITRFPARPFRPNDNFRHCLS